MKKQCKDCKSFMPVGDVGQCRRNPPQIDGKGQSSVDEFPIVRPDFWCGEFKKK